MVPIKGKQVLNVGCGNGDFCRRRSDLGAFVIGVDSSRNMIIEAQKPWFRAVALKDYPQPRYIIADINQTLPIQRETVDIVTVKMLMMYVDIDTAYQNIHRVLKPKGVFAVDIVHPFRPLLKTRISGSNRYDPVIN